VKHKVIESTGSPNDEYLMHEIKTTWGIRFRTNLSFSLGLTQFWAWLSLLVGVWSGSNTCVFSALVFPHENNVVLSIFTEQSTS
jgi:hypothetical protein